MSRAANLYRLQSIDTQLDARRARREAIRAALDQHAGVDQARQETALADARLEGARKALRVAEEAVQRQTEKIKETESRLYGGNVRNPKELQDLQREAEALKRHRSALEDRQLEAMLALEEAEASHALAHAALTAAEADAEQAHAELVAELRVLEAELDKLEIEREAAEAPISAEDRQTYAALRQRKRGIAVSRLDDGACSSCGVAPSSSRAQSARQGDELIRCGNCERILFAG